MNSRLAQHRKIQAQIKALQSELQALEADPEFAAESAFVQQLNDLMVSYDKSAAQVLAVLSPKGHARSDGQSRVRGPRQQLTYRNPHTGETVSTAGGNHRTLKAWKDQYPGQNIKEWIVGSDT